MGCALTTKSQIGIYCLRVMKAKIQLEGRGVRFKGRSALSVAKDYGYSGNRNQIVEQISRDLHHFQA